MSIENNATNILIKLYKFDEENGRAVYPGSKLIHLTQLKPDDINDAVDYLEERGLIERLNWKGTDPFTFGQIELNSKGRYIYQEIQKSHAENSNVENNIVAQQPIAAGSPFGFSDLDWEYTQMKISDYSKLIVVMGYQFESKYYNSDMLSSKIESQFKKALDRWNKSTNGSKLELDFIRLVAGYGEHLFNQIARDIISADIAVFETSDLNPNVMLELGVALT